MDRCLQSGLEKRTRVGAWQSRVYRLERGYLSAWPDVVSAAAKEQPSRTECLFQDDQVATVTDQGVCVCVNMVEIIFRVCIIRWRRSCAAAPFWESVLCFPVGLVLVRTYSYCCRGNHTRTIEKIEQQYSTWYYRSRTGTSTH